MKIIERYDGDLREIKHCCKFMTDSLFDESLMIDYDPRTKRYLLPRTWPHVGADVLFYCPWCSAKLTSLDTEMDRRRQEYQKECKGKNSSD